MTHDAPGFKKTLLTLPLFGAVTALTLLASCNGNNFAAATGTRRDAVATNTGIGTESDPTTTDPNSTSSPSGPTTQVTVPVSNTAPVNVPGGIPGTTCAIANTNIATVNAQTCAVTGITPGLTQEIATLPNGTKVVIPVTVTPDGATAGGTPGLSTDNGSATGTAPESLTTADGLVVNVPIAKIHIDALVDHDSTLQISSTAIYWEHRQLGAPKNTTITFYDQAGNVINTNPWVPHFAPGQGSNCPASVFTSNGLPYCKNDCDCQSDQVQLAQPPVLQGTLTNITAQGTSSDSGRHGQTGGIQVNQGNPLGIHILDCGDDCGRDVGYGLSGYGEYTFDVQ